MAKYPLGKKESTKAKGEIFCCCGKSPDSFLLSCLLQASPHYVSGNYIAERLKMSRVGIWSRVDKLAQKWFINRSEPKSWIPISRRTRFADTPPLEAWFKECDIDYPFFLLKQY